jgi:hypothetical protein
VAHACFMRRHNASKPFCCGSSAPCSSIVVSLASPRPSGWTFSRRALLQSRVSLVPSLPGLSLTPGGSQMPVDTATTAPGLLGPHQSFGLPSCLQSHGTPSISTSRLTVCASRSCSRAPASATRCQQQKPSIWCVQQCSLPSLLLWRAHCAGKAATMCWDFLLRWSMGGVCCLEAD